MITYLRQSSELYRVIKEEAEKAATPGSAYYSKMIFQSEEEVISEIKQLGRECCAWEADLSDPAVIPELFDRAEKQLGQVEIIVNIILPGAVQTGWMPEKLEKELAQSYPLRRIGEPEDIAKAVIFFSSRESDWITGHLIVIP